MPRLDVERIERILHRVWIQAPGAALRDEDRKKAVEVAGLLEEVARVVGQGPMVEAAAGKAYLAFVAAEVLGVRDLVLIERRPKLATWCRELAASLPAGTTLAVREGDVADAALWPARPRLAVALHACGTATDAFLERAVASAARWILAVPCCYAGDVPFAAEAEGAAAAVGAGAHPEVRRRLVTALVDARRTLRLEAAGYQTTVVAFVPPTVTPHNLLWRARRSHEPVRMARAAGKLAALERWVGAAQVA